MVFSFSPPVQGKERYSVLEAGNHDYLGGITINARESSAISYPYKLGNVYPTSLSNPFWEMHCTYFHSEVKRRTWRNDYPFVPSHARYVNHGGFSRIGELEVGVSSGGDYGLHALGFFFVKSWTVSKQLFLIHLKPTLID